MLFKTFLQNDIRRFALNGGSMGDIGDMDDNADNNNNNNNTESGHDGSSALGASWIPSYVDLVYKIQELYGFPHENAFLIKYADPDGDLVTVTNDAELEEMVDTLQLNDSSVAKIFVLPLGDAPQTMLYPTANATAGTASPLQQQQQQQQYTPQQQSQSAPQSQSHAQQQQQQPQQQQTLYPQQLNFQSANIPAPAYQETNPNAPSNNAMSDLNHFNHSHFDSSWKDNEIMEVLRDISWYISARDPEFAPLRVRSLGSIGSAKHFIPPEKFSQEMAAQQHRPLKVVSRQSISPNRLENNSIIAWNVDRVCHWLRQAGFGEFESKFRAHDISGDILLELNHEALRSMDILSAGKQLRLLKAISTLKPQLTA